MFQQLPSFAERLSLARQKVGVNRPSAIFLLMNVLDVGSVLLVPGQDGLGQV